MPEQRVDSDFAAADAPGIERYGCLFCRTGKEEKIIRELKALKPEFSAMAPTKLRYRRHGQDADEEWVRLFPGYVFFRTQDPKASVQDVRLLDDVLRLLTYADGRWELCGADERIARLFFEEHGAVGMSKAYYEGDRIHIADGFLKQYEGCITRVNRRARTAEIRVDFHGKIVTLWLGFELIEET